MSFLVSVAVLAAMFTAALLFALLLVRWLAYSEPDDAAEAQAFASFGDAMQSTGYEQRALKSVRLIDVTLVDDPPHPAWTARIIDEDAS